MGGRWVWLGGLWLLGAAAWAAPLRLGVERFVEQYQASLQGKRIAVLTHAAARLPDGRLSLELLCQRFHVVAIWAPEHGFWGNAPAGQPVADDTLFGLPVYSLYGPRRRPTAELLAGIDAVVVELQDVGLRPYTYVSTLFLVMDACAERGIPVYVLDRPNPLGGRTVEGAILDTAVRSFVGMLPIPYRHGCTIGEIAQMLNGEGWLPRGRDGSLRRCSLVVVAMQGWRRAMVWEETGLPWFPPSPNMATPTAVRAALMTGVLGEMGLWSIGIGTATPFQLLGAPDFPSEELAERLRAVLLPLGVRVGAVRFVPTSGPYARRECRGLFLAPESEGRFFAACLVLLEAVRSVMVGGICERLSPQARQMVPKVLGSQAFVRALCQGEPLEPFLERGLQEFQRLRQRYALYD